MAKRKEQQTVKETEKTRKSSCCSTRNSKARDAEFSDELEQNSRQTTGSRQKNSEATNKNQKQASTRRKSSR